MDYEGELGIIIGKGGLGIYAENAWEHVWGATIINDVSGISLVLSIWTFGVRGIVSRKAAVFDEGADISEGSL